MQKTSSLILALPLVLAACGGDSTNGGDSSPGGGTPPTSLTGVFLDSPVINIGYRTESLEGVTNASGEYEYIEGETVTFFIGDLEMPAVPASGTLTPLDLADSLDTSNDTVVNIIRLLQSLDDDGNPDNGIAITDQAKGAATQVDFNLSQTDFESSSAVTTLVANSGSTNVSLVSTSSAIAHLEGTLAQAGVDFVANANISGIWTTDVTDNDFLAFVFFADGTYVHLEVDEEAPLDEPGEMSGMEWGTYSRNNETGELTVTQTFDGNGDTGFTDATNGLTTLFAQVSGDVLTLQFDDNQNGIIEEDESLELSREASSGLLGAWTTDSTENDFLGFIFFDNGTYVHMEVDFNSSEISGMEWGTYSRDSSTGQLTATQTFDGNDDTGLSTVTNIDTFVQVSGDTLTLQVDDNQNGSIEEDESTDLQRERTGSQPFSIDMSDRAATSVLTYSLCPSVPGGYDYSFSDTSMTLSGSDGWQTPECILSDSETFTLVVAELDSDFDIPFNCANFPICTLHDLNKVVSGIGEDNRPFTSTFSFDVGTLTMTYIKAVEGTTFTEVITIN